MKFSILLTCSLLLGSGIAKAAALPHHHSTAQSAPAAVHGMVIFGSDTLYASHIPMFMVPHDWQAQFEISFEHADLDANKMFKELSQKDALQGLYTFKPKPFVLPDLLSGNINSFSGDLFKGNFEAGGKVILSNVTVNVKKAMNVTHLEKTTPLSASLNYLVVGKGSKSFLTHKIIAPDSFDQLIEIKWLQAAAQPSQELSLEVSDNLENRLKAGQLYKIGDDLKLIPTTQFEEASLQVIGEFSCTLGPDFFEPCE